MPSFRALCCRPMWNRISCPNERFRAVRLGVILLLGACAGEPKPAADTALAAAASARPQGSAPADTACPEFGAWRPCSVVDRLEDAGMVVKQESGPVGLPFFSVPGILYTTSRARIQVFLYGSADERKRDTEKLDSVAVAPRGETYSWPDPAVLVTSNNLAAIVVSPNERQLERIVLALSGGLPAR